MPIQPSIAASHWQLAAFYFTSRAALAQKGHMSDDNSTKTSPREGIDYDRAYQMLIEGYLKIQEGSEGRPPSIETSEIREVGVK